MLYLNSEIRRQDRLLDKQSAYNLLKKGEYGVLSMQCNETDIYGIPINYVWDDKFIYLHCATDGRKLQCLDKNNAVSFCIVGKTNVISEKFTTEYESIILECSATRKLSDEERMKALDLLINKYSPGNKDEGLEFAKKLLNRTEIIRLEIKKWTGKCKT